MTVPILLAILSGVIFVLLATKLYQRTLAAQDSGFLSPDSTMPSFDVWSDQWFQEFSSFRYLPMRRLLSESEEAYFFSHASIDCRQQAAFRADRRRLFREYLRCIQRDFQRMSQGVRVAIVNSTEDRSAEIKKLLELEWSFRKLLWQAELRLMFHWTGVRPVDATAIINALQGFEFSLREVRITPAGV